MDEYFGKVVSKLFNSWTALKIAVEQSDRLDAKMLANEFRKEVTYYLMEQPHASIDRIEIVIKDYLNEAFDVICEDGSPREIASILFSFLVLSNQGLSEQFQIKYDELPVVDNGVFDNPQQADLLRDVILGSDSECDTEEMDEEASDEADDGWIKVVKRR